MTKHTLLDEAIETWQKLAHWLPVRKKPLVTGSAPARRVRTAGLGATGADLAGSRPINPWSFSLVNFIGETKGDAELEAEI